MSGLRAFREAFLSSQMLAGDDFADFDSRKTRYSVFWAFYENSAYRAIHRWATSYKATFGLYRYIRNLYNPSYRLGEFWKTHIWGGALDPAAGDGSQPPSALPILTPNAALRPALSQLWKWSNWQIRKDIVTLWGTILGDVAIRVVDDTAKAKVYLDLVHPGTLANVTLDAYNNVKAYTIQEERPHPEHPSPLQGEGPGVRGRTVTYTETAERGPGEAVIFKTFLNDTPYPWNGQAAEWTEPYGFIPLVLIRHNDVGLDWGWSELHPARGKIQELDDLASLLSDQIRKSVNSGWLLAGVKKPKTALAVAGQDDNADTRIPQPGREELPMFYSDDPQAKPYPLVFPLDLEGTVLHITELLKELERDYPELRFDNLRVSGEVSGETLRIARQPVETKVIQRRALYDNALVRAHNMAVAIAGFRGLPGFESFDLGSYARGDLDHAIGPRPVFDIDELDRLAEQQAFWTVAGLAQSAGLPLKVFLQREGWSPAELAAIPSPSPSPSQGEEDPHRGPGEGETSKE